MDAFEAVSSPESIPSTGRKYFSVAEANRALTLVRRIVADIVVAYDELCELHAACRRFDAKGDTGHAERARRRYAFATDRLSELQEELEKVGCELKDFKEGWVDFPSLRDGREICLCWRLGQERLEHWHEITAAYADRQPIIEGVF